MAKDFADLGRREFRRSCVQLITERITREEEVDDRYEARGRSCHLLEMRCEVPLGRPTRLSSVGLGYVCRVRSSSFQPICFCRRRSVMTEVFVWPEGSWSEAGSNFAPPSRFVFDWTPTEACPVQQLLADSSRLTAAPCICDQLRSDYDAIRLKPCMYPTVAVALIRGLQA